MATEPDQSVVVIRSIYKAPDTLLPNTPSYVFPVPADRNTWYSSHKTTENTRMCRDCKTEPVERYKRFCTACDLKRNPERRCKGCDAVLVKVKRNKKNKSKKPSRNFCVACGLKHKETQEKTHREKRAKQTTLERIKTQVAWAQEKLLTTPLLSCKLASRFQGLRLPHLDQPKFNPDCLDCKGTGTNPEFPDDPCFCVRMTAPANRCRTCLQKFIDVQTVYLNNLMAEEKPEDVEATFNAMFPPETANAHAHAATA
jgi:hypothetical protein